MSRSLAGHACSASIVRLIQRDIRMEWSTLARVAYHDAELAWIDRPLVSRVAPVAEGACVEIERDVLRFSRRTFSNPFSSLSGRSTFADGSETYSCATSAPATLPVLVTSKLTATADPDAAFAGTLRFANLNVV